MAFFCFLRSKIMRRRRRRRPDNSSAIRHGVHLPEDHHHLNVDVQNCSISTPPARRFTWEEISDTLTDNFSRPIGSGGFSTVCLAQFPDSTLAAAKIQNCSSERLRRAFRDELQILLRLRHRNIVKLLGFSYDGADEMGALVLEYVPNGTLQEKLHNRRSGKVLPWKRRMAIAFQLAQAIEYLHEQCTLHIIHGDIKASNVLLDQQLNCKLCDFGSAKMGFSSSVMPPAASGSSNLLMLGSPGYVDPHYLRTGIASKKNDVYSFGIIVLELVTGKEAALFCPERRKMPANAADVAEMVDPGLDGEFDLEEAAVMASIAALCLSNAPALRPSAADIVFLIKEKIASVSFLFSADPQKRGNLEDCN
ncbi:probable receptor-like protein kinase At1g33260 [Diospyros lotus]|uniref:probable receptor-like protein kinase At1g33260 n=1 Tax=Diospyros lotus TaxID=55363 RepID=UPI002259B139|nr:probable receptor-like protein kinase At1g33260 [Diospyros lotus]